MSSSRCDVSSDRLYVLPPFLHAGSTLLISSALARNAWALNITMQQLVRISESPFLLRAYHLIVRSPEPTQRRKIQDLWPSLKQIFRKNNHIRVTGLQGDSPPVEPGGNTCIVLQPMCKVVGHCTQLCCAVCLTISVRRGGRSLRAKTNIHRVGLLLTYARHKQ